MKRKILRALSAVIAISLLVCNSSITSLATNNIIDSEGVYLEKENEEKIDEENKDEENTVSDNSLTDNDNTIIVEDDTVVNVNDADTNVTSISAEGDLDLSDKSTVFKDAAFRQYLKENHDSNKDNILSVDEIENVRSIDIILAQYRVKTMAGIEYLFNINNINITASSTNDFTSLDLSKNQELKTINISHVYSLKSIKLGDINKLKKIVIEDSSISELDLSKQTSLDSLSLYYLSNLSKLDISKNINLTYLKIQNVNISAIDISNNINLKELTIQCDYESQCTTDFSKNTELENITFYYIGNKSYDFSNNINLKKLSIYDNKLTVVDISKNIDLKELIVGGLDESVKQIDLSNNKELESICLDSCDGITEVDLSNNKELKSICLDSCDGITEIDLTNNPEVTNLDCYLVNLKKLNLGASDKFYEINIGKCPKVDKEMWKSIDFSRYHNLHRLHCMYYKNDSLDLSGCTKLEVLSLFYSEIDNLDFTKCHELDAIQIVDCKYKSLNLSGQDISRSYKYDIRNEEKMAHHFLITEEQLEDLKSSYFYDSKVDTYEFVEDTYIDIDEINFPDEAFRKYISEVHDKNSDNRLSGTEILLCKDIELNGEDNIESIKGIKYFKYLKELILTEMQLKEIDISENINLESLSLEKIPVTSIDLSNNIYLEKLKISNTNITELDISNNKNLRSIKCNDNQLNELDFTDLKYFFDDNAYENISEFKNNNGNIIVAWVTEEQYEQCEKNGYVNKYAGQVEWTVHKSHEALDDKWYYDGATHYQICKICLKNINEEAHNSEKIAAVPSTCITNGMPEYYKCKCGYFEDEECTKKIDDIENWKKEQILPVGQHIWGMGTITKQPSFYAIGTRTYTCEGCGITKTEDINRLEYIEVPVKGKYDLKPAVQYLFTEHNNNSTVSMNSKYKYIVDDKKKASVSSKGILKAKKDGTVKVTVYERNAAKLYVELVSFDVKMNTVKVNSKVSVLSSTETVDLNTLVTDVPAGYAVNFSLSKSNAKKVDFNKQTNIIKPIKKGTIIVKCTIGEGKYAVKKNIKIVAKF